MADLFLTLIGWIHAIAAVAWVGGGIFYWVVLRPAVRSGVLPETATRFAAVEFGQLVTLAMWTLVVTGGVLMFTKLSESTATLPYGIVLATKVLLSAWMFFLVVNRRGRRTATGTSGRLRSAVNALGHVNMTVVLGVIVFLLSDILRWLVVRELSS
jgi:uncharacterized membrane protein